MQKIGGGERGVHKITGGRGSVQKVIEVPLYVFFFSPWNASFVLIIIII